MRKGSGQFGLDDRSVEELKDKAIAAKGRAYCRCRLSTLSIPVLRSVCINLEKHSFASRRQDPEAGSM